MLSVLSVSQFLCLFYFCPFVPLSEKYVLVSIIMFLCRPKKSSGCKSLRPEDINNSFGEKNSLIALKVTNHFANDRECRICLQRYKQYNEDYHFGKLF